MIYLFASISHALVLGYGVAMSPSVPTFAIASLALAAGGASFIFKKIGILSLSTLLTIVLYLINLVPGSGEIRVFESIAIGSALFVQLEISRDLILMRARRIEFAAYKKRLRSIGWNLGVSAAITIFVLTIGASVNRHIPRLAQLGFSIPVFAVLIFGLGVFVLSGTANGSEDTDR